MVTARVRDGHSQGKGWSKPCVQRESYVLQDRKVIVKSLKGLVGNVCSEEHGHLVLLALLDCVDDTVLVKKAVLSVSEMYSCCHGNVLVNSVPSSHVTNSFSPSLWCVCV